MLGPGYAPLSHLTRHTHLDDRSTRRSDADRASKLLVLLRSKKSGRIRPLFSLHSGCCVYEMIFSFCRTFSMYFWKKNFWISIMSSSRPWMYA